MQHKLPGLLLIVDSAFEKKLKIQLYTMIQAVKKSYELIFIDKKDERKFHNSSVHMLISKN